METIFYSIYIFMYFFSLFNKKLMIYLGLEQKKNVGGKEVSQWPLNGIESKKGEKPKSITEQCFVFSYFVV